MSSLESIDVLQQIPQASPTLYERIRAFQAKVLIRHESDDFLIRSAQTSADLLKVLQLRHEIFYQEWRGQSTETGLDVEDYDFVGDHLMIIDKSTEEVVGTYRLLASQFVKSFYSESEFQLDQFLMWPSVKLELGRACVQAQYRDGNTIDMLWKGLSRYITATQARYLFGCSSIKSCDPQVVAALMVEMERKGQRVDDFRIRPTKEFTFPVLDLSSPEALDVGQVRELIPPLLRSYLHAGAKVYGLPALDRHFGCTDLFTVLDMQSLNRRFRQRYFPQ